MPPDSTPPCLLPECSPVEDYLRCLRQDHRLKHLVAEHRLMPGRQAAHADPVRPWPPAIARLLEAAGIDRLYSHQARAADLLRSGRHVVVATPTASGKTLISNLPVLERFLRDPDAKALSVFPLKALAQDQLRGFEQLTAPWPKSGRPQAAIYDGDTTSHFRRKIRDNPPAVLMTNPEMLHLSLLAHHERWTTFIAGLSFVVVDEVHTYRGILGSHMAQVFRRLLRVCARLGVSPTFVFCSATVGNPGELARQLTGLTAETVVESGSPQGPRHVVFLNPQEGEHGPAQAALLLLQSALRRNLRTIVYTQSRKLTELLSLWANERLKEYAGRISAYRAGFLPEERREIEARMTSGELLAVVSTSALELGIDIGALDLCILVGYPGTVMATLQRGGRVGRSLRESAVVLVAGEDALDQYFMRHPEDFFQRPPEQAVLNPDNPVLLARHLECAAAELPLRQGEPWLSDPAVSRCVQELEQSGTLLRSADGSTLYAARKQPHRDLSLRGTGRTLTIRLAGTDQPVGEVDEHRAYKETHPGAVYLHRGDTYVVEELDLQTRAVLAAPKKVDYFTRTRGNKDTEILEIHASRTVWGANIHLGRLRVTEQITGYEKRRVQGNRLMNIVPLDLPPLTFETQGLWLEIPKEVEDETYGRFLDFRGGIHALEHAAIGILPLLVMTDRNDLGGMSVPLHPQTSSAAVFIYDAAPGGVGLSSQAFHKAEELLKSTLAAIRDCGCESGCPSCVHSPKCGSGNRPIDKAAALTILETLRDMPAGRPPTVPPPRPEPASAPAVLRSAGPVRRYGVLDVETRRSAEECGGWQNCAAMGVSVAVLYDSMDDACRAFSQDELPGLFERLRELALLIGFNIRRFDCAVLQPFARYDLHSLTLLDLLEEVRARLGIRLSLEHLARETLNAAKSATGLQALEWWKEGRIDEIARYCEQDVLLTRDLYLHGRDKGYLLYKARKTHLVRIPANW